MKTTTNIPHFTTPSGLVFVPAKRFADTLFQPIGGSTASGYYKTRKRKRTRGLELYHPNGELFAVVLSDGVNAQARSASRQPDGKIWAMFALSSRDEALLGVGTMGCRAESEFWVGVVAEAHAAP